MNSEEIKHLELLSIFHYVVGGIIALFSCMFFMHVFMGIAMLNGSFFGESTSGELPPPFMGWMFLIMGSGAILFGWITAIFIIVAGRKLKARKSRLFCIIVAGIECMFMPFGTVLGIFTLITLTKESVKELFEQNA